MALQLHVPGTSAIFLGVGAANALVELGVSVDGVDISLNYNYSDVMTDQYGPSVPFDVQMFLYDAHIKIELVWFEQAVLLAIQPGTNPMATAAPPFGSEGFAGNLLLQNAQTFRLVVRNTPPGVGLTVVEPCYNFFNCYLIDSAEVKYGVVKSVWNLTFRAIPNQEGSGSFGAGLYNSSCV
jgi:hypothetical protein